MKKTVFAKTISAAAAAALLVNSITGATVFAYDGNYDYEFTYSGTTVEVSTDADGAADTSGYTLEGTVITITGVGTYVVTGSGENGNITVEKGNDGVVLIFEDLTLTSASEETVTVGKNSEVEIVAEGENTLTNTNTDGAVIKIKSGASVSITGDGTLTVDASEGKNGIKGAAEATLIIGESAEDTFTLNVSAANNGIASDGRVIVNGGTINITSDGDGLKSSPDEDDTASDGTVTINSGNISITSAEDGVQADGGLTINGGTLNIVAGGGAANAASLGEDDSAKGLKSDSYILIAGGDITIDSADDGIHLNGTTGGEELTITNGTIKIASGDDGIKSDYTLNIGTEGSTDSPDITITQSYEGLEGATVNLYSGTAGITASDDGINAANSDLSSYNFSINISGGTWYINAGGDGIDSNGDLNVSGGTATVFGSANGGNAALDVGDNGGKFNVTGGTIVGVGMSDMSIVPSSGSYLSFGNSGGMGAPGGFGQQQSTSSVSISEGSVIEIKDAEGNTVYTATAEKSANSIVFASDTLESGASYTLYVDGKSVSETTVSTGNGSTGGMFGDNGTQPTPPDRQTGDNGTQPTPPEQQTGDNGTQPTPPNQQTGENGTQPTPPEQQTGDNGTQPTPPEQQTGENGTQPTPPEQQTGENGTMPTPPEEQTGENGTQPTPPEQQTGDNGTQPTPPEQQTGDNGTQPTPPEQQTGDNGTMPTPPEEQTGENGTQPTPPDRQTGENGTEPAPNVVPTGENDTTPIPPVVQTGENNTDNTPSGEQGGESEGNSDISTALTNGDKEYVSSDLRAAVSGSGTLFSGYFVPTDIVLVTKTETKETAAAVLTEYLARISSGASFEELEALFENEGIDFAGDKDVIIGGVTVWQGWSEEAVELLMKLIREGKIKVIVSFTEIGEITGIIELCK